MRYISTRGTAPVLSFPFIGDTFNEAEFRGIIDRAYGSFYHQAICPINQIGHNHFLLELFHGPTLAFKDVAMQLIGQIRVSEVQRRQMTTPKEANVHALAVEGDFDDCQARLKDMFNDFEFRDGVRLAGVNSINWARVMAQVVYYFTAAVSLGAPERSVSFTVPTGNFGDIFAGYVAKRMGLPIERLVIATNQNDILHRTLVDGSHSKEGVTPSISPSMDIQVSSNFERLLFDLYDREGAAVAQVMDDLNSKGAFDLSQGALAKLHGEFDSGRASEDETSQTIKFMAGSTGQILCPHTAVGIKVADEQTGDASVPMVTLATAHAAKFPDAVEAACGERPSLPPHMADMYD